MTKKFVLLIIFAVLIISAFYLRFIRLTTNPGWFRDEGTYYNVARTIDTSPRVGALNCTFVSPFMTHPPFFFYLNNIWFKITHDSMQSFRRFSALCSLLTMLMLYLIGKKTGSVWLGVLAAAIYIYHPMSVMFSRMALPYNLYAFFASFVLYSSIVYVDKNGDSMQKPVKAKSQDKSKILWLSAGTIASALSLYTVYYSWVFIIYLAVVIISQKNYKHLLILIIIPIPLGVFLAKSYFSGVPGFTEDFKALLSANQSGSLKEILYHYKEFFGMGVLFSLGSAGLIMFNKNIHKFLAAFFTLLIINVVLMKKDTQISFINYPVIPVLPLLSLGLAGFIIYFSQNFILKIHSGLNISKPLSVTIGIFLTALFSLLFLPSIEESFSSVKSGFKTPLDFGMVKNKEDAYRAADIVNQHIGPDSVVISTTVLWWLINTPNSAELYQSHAYNGVKWDFYYYDISKKRFLFNPSVENASVIVIDNFTNLRSDRIKAWKPTNPLDDSLNMVENEWRKLDEIGEYKIYMNPKFQTRYEDKITTGQ